MLKIVLNLVFTAMIACIDCILLAILVQKFLNRVDFDLQTFVIVFVIVNLAYELVRKTINRSLKGEQT